MTEEQYQVLLKYEQQLTAAAKCNFLRMSASDFNVLAAVYDNLFRPLRPSQRNCNTCRLNALKSLYNAFIGEKMEREVKAQKEVEEAARNAENNPQEEDGLLKPAETPENGTEIPVEEVQTPKVEETPEDTTETPVEEPQATKTNAPKATKTNKGTTTNKKKAGRPKKIDIEE